MKPIEKFFGVSDKQQYKQIAIFAFEERSSEARISWVETIVSFWCLRKKDKLPEGRS